MSTKGTAKPPLTLYTSMTLIWFFLSARFHLTCAGENWAEMTANGKRCVTPKSKSTTSSLRRQVLKRFGWMLHKCFTGRLPWANIAAAKARKGTYQKTFYKTFSTTWRPRAFYTTMVNLNNCSVSQKSIYQHLLWWRRSAWSRAGRCPQRLAWGRWSARPP